MAELLTNYIAYATQTTRAKTRTRIGHFNFKDNTITPLCHASGTPLTWLYEVIEAGSSNIIPSPDPIVSASSVRILPPLPGRDILAIGKNYPDHAKEFNASGYDASDTQDMPSHPVVFTKRSTSIVAHEEPILLFPDFTKTLDYEGEIGVIIGRTAHAVKEEDAQNYIWGYTIINDVTARERQRDHKQFFVGKSGDTFCPMGPIAVPKESLPGVLHLQTRVNGESRQEGATSDLIFSIPRLIETISEAQTLRAGDVIATGTPAGVGFGLQPPQFLKAGDVIEIEVTGLGILRNKVALESTPNYVHARMPRDSTIPTHNLDASQGVGLLELNLKSLYCQTIGDPDGPPLIFVHALGGTHTSFMPLIRSLKLASRYRCILYDLEGHGLSPTQVSSSISIASYATDLAALFQHAKIKPADDASIIAQGMGCLVASHFMSKQPDLVKKLLLINPIASPLSKQEVLALRARAQTVRNDGMAAIAESHLEDVLSSTTLERNPLAFTAVLQSLLSQDPEGYAKGCTALAAWAESGYKTLGNAVATLAVVGEKDAPANSLSYADSELKNLTTRVLSGVGQWAVFENVEKLAEIFQSFLLDCRG